MSRAIEMLRAAFDRKTWPVAAALLLLIAAVVTPRVMLARDTFRYMVTFDLTQSMDVRDLQTIGVPTSRLAFAKDAVRESLRALPCGSKIGWSIFADYRVLPLLLPVEVCSHYEELLASLEQIDGRMRWANASNIGKGVTWALRTARQMEPHTNVIFLTDGNEAPPLRAAELPPMAGITPGEIGGWLVGVGGDLAVPIPKTDRDGKPAGYWGADEVVQRPGPGPAIEHLSRRDDDHLQALATGLGLGFARLTDSSTLTRAMLDGQLAWRQPVSTDLRSLPAVLALLLLVWRFWPEWSRGRWAAAPRSRGIALAAPPNPLTRFQATGFSQRQDAAQPHSPISAGGGFIEL